jgi:hypothetical protein
MLAYRRIPIWENRRRRRVLALFKTSLEEFALNYDPGPMRHERRDHSKAEAARVQINRILHHASDIIEAAGVNPVVVWSPPPVVGGRPQEIDVVLNVFNLERYLIPFSPLYDYIERALGIYEHDERAAAVRTVNPIYWLGRVFDYVSRLPFIALSRAGFDAGSIEDSLVGRLFRFTVYVVGGLASLVTILEFAGATSVVRSTIQRMLP